MSRSFVAMRGAAALLAILSGATAWCADPPADAASERVRLESQYALRYEADSDPELDPVVFTEIVPFTADENAVRLPPDQDLD